MQLKMIDIPFYTILIIKYCNHGAIISYPILFDIVLLMNHSIYLANFRLFHNFIRLPSIYTIILTRVSNILFSIH